MPSVSVIITTHSRPHLLARAVDSARQAGTDLEVVVVDDASTDETAEVCRSLSGINYVRVERNRQVAGARNIGILNSRGDYITFLDDDDVRLAGSINLQAEALASAPEVGLVYGQALIADHQGRVTRKFYPECCPQGQVFWELLARNFIPCGAALFRRSCLLRVGLLDETVPGIDDWDLWVRIASLYPVMAVNEPAMIWRRPTPFSGQGASRADRLARLSTSHIRRKWLKLPCAAQSSGKHRREARRRFSKNMASHLAVETARATMSGHFLQARKNAVAAISLHPWESARAVISPATVKFLVDGVKGRSRTTEG